MDNENQDDRQQTQQSSIFGLGSFMDEVEEAKPSETPTKSDDNSPTKEQIEKMAAQQQQNMALQMQMQAQLKQQQQAQLIQYQQMLASMTPQQQQITQARMLAMQQQQAQQQQQYAAAMLMKHRNQQMAMGGQRGDAGTKAMDQQAQAQAQMFAAFQMQQRPMMPPFPGVGMQAQGNPYLLQQQMIQNMQQFQQNQMRQFNQKAPEKTEEERPVRAEMKTLTPAEHDQRVELIRQLQAAAEAKTDRALLEGSVDDEAKLTETNEKIHARLRQLLDNLVEKIQKKHDSLMLSQQQLQIFQQTLQQKYGPVFLRMEAILAEKKLEYMSHLVDSLEANYHRVGLEKEALDKLEKGFADQGIKMRFKEVLEEQAVLIKQHVERQAKIREHEKTVEAKRAAAKPKWEEMNQERSRDAEKADKEDDGMPKLNLPPAPEPVDADKIKAVTTMIDQFNNIVAKNFSVYGQYNDFSFASSRSADDIDAKLSAFFSQHFSGDFQLKNSFEKTVHPRIFYLEQRTQFIYSYKIANYMTQAIMIANKFNVPDQCRHCVNPQGQLFMFGGFDPTTQEFSKDAWVLDEYRSLFKPLAPMQQGRADHVVIYFRDNIYVLGGMAYRGESEGGAPFAKSLNSAEMFNIKSQTWTTLESFNKPRQAFSICQFNEKFIFIIGGKTLKAEAKVGMMDQMANTTASPYVTSTCPYDFVTEVEAYDIEKGLWKTINYITDSAKLRTLYAGSIQVTGKKIMIFGGIVEADDDQGEAETMHDGARAVQLTAQSFYLDVTKGSIKRGPDLVTPGYYVNNGGCLLNMQNKLYAQGFGLNQDLVSKEKVRKAARDLSITYHHKKILHCYDLAEQSFTEIHEGIFSSAKRTDDPNLSFCTDAREDE